MICCLQRGQPNLVKQREGSLHVLAKHPCKLNVTWVLGQNTHAGKEKLMLFSDHKGSLLRQQPGVFALYIV